MLVWYIFVRVEKPTTAPEIQNFLSSLWLFMLRALYNGLILSACVMKLKKNICKMANFSSPIRHSGFRMAHCHIFNLQTNNNEYIIGMEVMKSLTANLSNRKCGFHILSLANFQLPLTRLISRFVSLFALCSLRCSCQIQFFFLSRLISQVTWDAITLCNIFMDLFPSKSFYEVKKFIHTFEEENKQNKLKLKTNETNFQSLLANIALH